MPTVSRTADQESKLIVSLKAYCQTYAISFIGGNLSLVVGHPAERLKVAVQAKLNLPAMQVINPLISNMKLLCTGFTSCVYRQNVKIVYRSLIMSEMPHRVDDLNLNLIFSSALKALFASSIDTAFVTPPENIKTRQMCNTEKQVGVREAASDIYRARGLKGFFFGATPTMCKSFPAWLYLFLGYHVTKDKREKQGFWATIFWATCASIPITILTNPLDVVKTQMQATLDKESSSLIKTGKNIYQNHGLFAFGKGVPFRLLHKALATSTAYVSMDWNNRLRGRE